MRAEGNSKAKGNGSAQRRRIVDITFSFNVNRLNDVRKPVVIIRYRPLIGNVDGSLDEVEVLSGSIKYDWNKVRGEVCQKLESLERGLVRLLPSYEVGVTSSDSATVVASVRSIGCSYRKNPPVNLPDGLDVAYFLPTEPDEVIGTKLAWESLSRSEQLLVSNIASWVKKQAWEHLTNRVREVSGKAAIASRYHKVFISYKKKSKAEEIAVTIASRLSQPQQGIDVWFDKWEIKAGDSIPGKIAEGFKDSDACLIFLSRDFGGSEWCTKEMNTALVKGIEEDLTVIPSLVEVCDVPELLKELRRVDFIEFSATQFEQKLQEIIDAIYRVDLNPYR